MSARTAANRPLQTPRLPKAPPGAERPLLSLAGGRGGPTGSADRRPRAALWLRVSTDEQNLENQRLQLTPLAVRLGCDIGKEFAVTGSAWTGAHLPELDRALNDAKAGLFQVLIVWKLDRLTRQGGAAQINIIESFVAAGCQIRSLHDSWLQGPLTHDDEPMAYLAGWSAKGYSERLSLATKAGIARRRAQGLPVGRPKGKKDKEGTRRPRQGYEREAARRKYLGIAQYAPRH